MDHILLALAADLKERGDLDLSECFIDGTFVVAKQGVLGWVISVDWSCVMNISLRILSPL